MINTMRFTSLVKSELIKALTEQHKLSIAINHTDITTVHKVYLEEIEQINKKTDKEILDWYLGEVHIEERTICTMLHQLQLNSEEQLPF